MRAPHSGCGGRSAGGGATAGGAAGELCGFGHETAATGLGPGLLHAWAALRGLGWSSARVPGVAGVRSPCPASTSNSRTLRSAAAGNTSCLASTLSSG